MKYQFCCSKCKKENTVDMAIADYEKYEAKCSKCGCKMDRVYGEVCIGGGCSGSCEESCNDDDCGSSCSSGSCSGCSGCGG